MKPIFPPFTQEHLSLSNKLAPPERIYENIPTVKFIKRIIVPMENLILDARYQTREGTGDAKHISSLREYKSVNGEVLSDPPKVVIQDPQNPGIYKIVSGFHRSHAERKLGWPNAIVDVVEELAPGGWLDVATATNNHRPSKSLDKNDIIKSVEMAAEAGYVEKTEKALTKYVYDRYSFKHGSTLNAVIRAVINSLGVPQLIKDYDSEQAKTIMDELGILYGQKYQVYAKDSGDNKTSYIQTTLDAFSSADENFTVTLYGWVKNPKSTNIRAGRVRWLREFDELTDHYYMHIAHALMISLEEAKAISKRKAPFVFGGFLPQDLSADASKGGYAKEEGIVDENGKPFGEYAVVQGTFINQPVRIAA